MSERIALSGLNVAVELQHFIETQALPGTGVEPNAFWSGLAEIVAKLGPKNAALLKKRDDLQAQIDAWHIERRGSEHKPAQYEQFLRDIGYLVDEGDAFQIDTANVDPEIAQTPGPQLVVPITNARFALNAVNARWGSLYDCFYGTDAMGTLPPAGGYDRGHGARVVARSRVFLDETFPIQGASHADVRRYYVHEGQLLVDDMPLAQPENLWATQATPRRLTPSC